jgi:hypothetical protein
MRSNRSFVVTVSVCALAWFGCSGSTRQPPKDSGADRTDSGGSVGLGGSGGSSGLGGRGGSTGSGGSGNGGSGSGGSGAPDSGVMDAGPCGADAGEAGSSTADMDFDGVIDCLDGCPNDLFKQAPGVCGCGISDMDSDGDGVVDCMDMCPEDPAKTTSMGVCGCGKDDTLNTDGDSQPDCLDACPKDPTKTTAGPCGCLPDTLAPVCLAHRYSFDGPAGSMVATDTVGGPAGNGATVNVGLSGNGTVVLAGVATDQYINLPAGLISTMGNSATFEAWVTWAPVNGSQWQRIFDFGNSDQGAGAQGTGQSYIFLTPRAGSNFLRVAISLGSFGAEDLVDGVDRLPSVPMTHVAVVVDGAMNMLRLYQNGRPQPPGATGVAIRPATTLSSINDVSNWLGRSLYVNDQEFAGTFYEFRVYSRALTSAQINANAVAGPDVVVGGPPPPDGGAGDAPDSGGGSGDAGGSGADGGARDAPID